MFVGSIVCLSDRIWYFPDKFEAFSGHPICFYIYEWEDGGRNISIQKLAHTQKEDLPSRRECTLWSFWGNSATFYESFAQRRVCCIFALGEGLLN